LKEEDYRIAKILKARISRIAPLIDLKVFGSRARDAGGEFSDLDVYIEVPTLDKATKDQIREAVWEVGFENFVFISSLIVTHEEVANSPLRSSPIIRNIAEEGISI
jgi:predicted nucleotidyltransferase